jgi:hypothetical protein
MAGEMIGAMVGVVGWSGFRSGWLEWLICIAGVNG